MKIGVILFPGTNCELEALRACGRSRMKAEVFRWNDDRKKLKQYDAFILPGGFSYEDRGRSGVIAAQDPIVEVIFGEAQKGKPVLGVCNGAQILVEAGMIPGLESRHLEMSLTWNERVKKGEILGVGFYNDWINIRSDARKRRSVFNRFSSGIVMRIPVAHGEGRFTTREKNLLENLIANEQTLFRYCDEDGNIVDEFPVNPNGALYNLAGVCNLQGNVLALMPHPERTLNGQPIFDSIADYLASGKKTPVKKIPKMRIGTLKEKIEKPLEKADIVITVELIITDNEERTVENALKGIGFKNLKLRRKLYYGFKLKKGENAKTAAQKIIRSGELINLNKEIPTIYIGEKVYGYDKTDGLFEKKIKDEGAAYCVTDYDNYAGNSVAAKLAPYFKKGAITKSEKGVYWAISLKKKDQVEKLLQTHILHNPHAMRIVALNS